MFQLQKRIYRARQRGDWKTVRGLQRLLRRSRAARTLAVRRVTQDNSGKNTPGIDGVAKLTPKERLGDGPDHEPLGQGTTGTPCLDSQTG